MSCTEPLPPFKLPKSNLTQAQETTMCACIWAHLDNAGQQISEKVAHHKEAEIADADIASFPTQFVGAIKSCGG